MDDDNRYLKTLDTIFWTLVLFVLTVYMMSQDTLIQAVSVIAMIAVGFARFVILGNTEGRY